VRRERPVQLRKVEVLGDAIWNALDITARACLASAEKLFRERRNEPSFDFAPVIAAFAKAPEIQVNATLQSALAVIPARARLVQLEKGSVSLDKAGPLSLGQLARAIGREPELNQALPPRLNYGSWFTGSLPAMLDDFRSVRNTAVHNGRIDQKTAAYWRNRMLGVGTEGVFAQLARVRLR
jgi:hypothetical protein